MLPPLAARSAGYSTRTFGPAPTLGVNLKDYNFGGVTPVGGQSVQNSDGSITLPISDGSGFGGGIASAHSTGGSGWTGVAFGGGFYIEAAIKFTAALGSPSLPFPAFWMQSIDFLTGQTLQWPGQTAGYIHRIELDLMQWPHNSTAFYFGNIIYDWYGPAFFNSIQSLHGVAIAGTAGQFTCTDPIPFSLVVGAFYTMAGTAGGTGSITGYTNPATYKISATNGSTTFTLTNLDGSALTTAVGTLTGLSHQINVLGQPTPDQGSSVKISQSVLKPVQLLSDYHLYGCLWIPATATTQGSLTNYLDGVPVIYATGAPNQKWNQYNPAAAPPPIINSSAASLLDVSKMVIILGTDTTCPMTIGSVSVWQNSGADNLVQ